VEKADAGKAAFFKEAGFDYFTTIEDVQIFRKRKYKAVYQCEKQPYKII